MKKILIAFIVLALLIACAQSSFSDAATEYASLAEINHIAGTNLVHPAVMGVSEESFSILTTDEGFISQYSFTVAGFAYTFRSACFDSNISGMNADGKPIFTTIPSAECEFYYGDGFMLSRWKTGINQYSLCVEDPDSIMDRETFRLISWEMQELSAEESAVVQTVNSGAGLTGEYDDSFSQRAWAKISLDDAGMYIIEIHWADSAEEYYRWSMTLLQNGDKLVYTDGVCSSISTRDDGTEKIITVYDGATGFFTLSEGKLLWDGAENDYCRDCVFEKTQQ